MEIMDIAEELHQTSHESIDNAIQDICNAPEASSTGGMSRRQLKRAGSRRQAANGANDVDVNSSGAVDYLKLVGMSEEYLERERMLGLQKGGLESAESWRENLAPEGTREVSTCPSHRVKKFVQNNLHHFHPFLSLFSLFFTFSLSLYFHFINSDKYHEKRGLPAGSTRKVLPGFEEIFCPAPARPPAPAEEELVQISSLPPWAQGAFEGLFCVCRY